MIASIITSIILYIIANAIDQRHIKKYSFTYNFGTPTDIKFISVENRYSYIGKIFEYAATIGLYTFLTSLF